MGWGWSRSPSLVRDRSGPSGDRALTADLSNESGFERSTACYARNVSEVISQRELRNDSGRIMRALDEGRSFVLTRNSVPVGELRPLRRHRMVDTRLVSEMFRHAPRIDREQFLRDLDNAVDQGVEPRA